MTYPDPHTFPGMKMAYLDPNIFLRSTKDFSNFSLHFPGRKEPSLNPLSFSRLSKVGMIPDHREKGPDTHRGWSAAVRTGRLVKDMKMLCRKAIRSMM